MVKGILILIDLRKNEIKLININNNVYIYDNYIYVLNISFYLI